MLKFVYYIASKSVGSGLRSGGKNKTVDFLLLRVKSKK